MKFRAFKSFVAGKVEDYLRKDLAASLRDLMIGLRKLSFSDNFESFEANTYIPAGETVAIGNRLSFIPGKRIIVRQTGGGAIIDGTPPWTLDNLYLKNTGSSDAKISVVFMR